MQLTDVGISLIQYGSGNVGRNPAPVVTNMDKLRDWIDCWKLRYNIWWLRFMIAVERDNLHQLRRGLLK